MARVRCYQLQNVLFILLLWLVTTIAASHYIRHPDFTNYEFRFPFRTSSRVAGTVSNMFHVGDTIHEGFDNPTFMDIFRASPKNVWTLEELESLEDDMFFSHFPTDFASDHPHPQFLVRPPTVHPRVTHNDPFSERVNFIDHSPVVSPRLDSFPLRHAVSGRKLPLIPPINTRSRRKKFRRRNKKRRRGRRRKRRGHGRRIRTRVVVSGHSMGRFSEAEVNENDPGDLPYSTLVEPTKSSQLAKITSFPLQFPSLEQHGVDSHSPLKYPWRYKHNTRETVRKQIRSRRKRDVSGSKFMTLEDYMNDKSHSRGYSTVHRTAYSDGHPFAINSIFPDAEYNADDVNGQPNDASFSQFQEPLLSYRQPQLYGSGGFPSLSSYGGYIQRPIIRNYIILQPPSKTSARKQSTSGFKPFPSSHRRQKPKPKAPPFEFKSVDYYIQHMGDEYSGFGPAVVSDTGGSGNDQVYTDSGASAFADDLDTGPDYYTNMFSNESEDDGTQLVTLNGAFDNGDNFETTAFGDFDYFSVNEDAVNSQVNDPLYSEFTDYK